MTLTCLLSSPGPDGSTCVVVYSQTFLVPRILWLNLWQLCWKGGAVRRSFLSSHLGFVFLIRAGSWERATLPSTAFPLEKSLCLVLVVTEFVGFIFRFSRRLPHNCWNTGWVWRQVGGGEAAGLESNLTLCC